MFHASKTVLAGLFAIALSTTAMAAQPQLPSTGLGQAWPNATDVSTSPHYHVYVFQKDGVRFIQVNDLNGNVLGAMATAGNQVLALPVGTGTKVANTTAAAASTSGATETVYADQSVQLKATAQSSGTVVSALLISICSEPWACGAGAIVISQ